MCRSVHGCRSNSHNRMSVAPSCTGDLSHRPLSAQLFRQRDHYSRSLCTAVQSMLRTHRRRASALARWDARLYGVEDADTSRLPSHSYAWCGRMQRLYRLYTLMRILSRVAEQCRCVGFRPGLNPTDPVQYLDRLAQRCIVHALVEPLLDLKLVFLSLCKAHE